MYQRKIEEIKEIFNREFKEIKTLEDLQSIKVKFLGRKGVIRNLIQLIKKESLEIRKEIGKKINKLKIEIEDKLIELENKLGKEEIEKILDPTIPGKGVKIGHFHPITIIFRKLIRIFQNLGFEVVEGPEIETEEYNFDFLNIPEEHPARDMWDTYYIKFNKNQKKKTRLVLRTHTSPMQIRAMYNRKPPVKIIVPGRVFRHEATDARHECIFYQLEGLCIDENITLSNLITTLEIFCKNLFGKDTKIRVRQSFFPFTEPSIEVDTSCILCKNIINKKCKLCKGTGFIEILGAGMVHPKVLKNMGVDFERYKGFAFGLGVDRIMMIYFGVDDVRLSYSSDLMFINQF